MSLTSNIDSIMSNNGESLLVNGHSRKKNNDKAGRTLIRPKIGINTFIKDSPILTPLKNTNGFLFPYRPTITWASNVTYGNQSLTHSIQDFKYFIRNNSTTFTISGVFTSENNDTALYTLACFHFLRSISKMHFGGFTKSNSSVTQDTENSMNNLLTSAISSDPYIGSPPPLLTISTYGDYIINNLSVILESFSMSFPDDVDYISIDFNGSKIELPVITTITMTVTTQNTPEKAREFSYDDFKNGSLVKKGGWF